MPDLMFTGEGHVGSVDVANINVVAVVPYIIMKTAALGRGKAKDAYDIYFIAAICVARSSAIILSVV